MADESRWIYVSPRMRVGYDPATREIILTGWYDDGTPLDDESRLPLARFVAQLALPLVPSDYGDEHDWERIPNDPPFERYPPDRLKCVTCGAVTTRSVLEEIEAKVQVVAGCPWAFRVKSKLPEGGR